MKQQSDILISISRTEDPEPDEDEHYAADILDDDPAFPSLDASVQGLAYCPDSIS